MGRSELERRIGVAMRKSSLFQSIYGYLEEDRVEKIVADITGYLMGGKHDLHDIPDDRQLSGAGALDYISDYIGAELERASIDAECDDTDGLALSIIFVYREYLSNGSAVISKISSRGAVLREPEESSDE
jgi:hypothetical protein